MGCRVVLRRMRAGDEEEFVRLARQSTELHADWVRTPADPAAFRDYLGRFADPTAGEALLVKQADTGAIAGHVTLTGIVRRPYDRAILGFAAFAPSAGQGYMTEGVGLAVLYAFGPLGLHRVEADVQPGNEPSRRLVQRLGFRREGFSPEFINIGGVWRDHERWAITAGMTAHLPPCDRHVLP
ncbi:GNAT family N-acetyltransferase [Actinomadura madurae]|uniref:GNAT family N-acetyltransferase n=1 Tax=Actinomadura madurae TaxID=1993 RepID=UPI0020265AE3|nr:GNAT family protein [Actinomadura madurae]URN08927.1 GNAT family N-acetyltransferase [Actinomadura madurae]